MSTPYEAEFTVTTTTSDEIVSLNFPGRCIIDRVAAVKISGGSLALTLYSRAFTGPAVGVKQIVADSTGDFCEIQFTSPFAVKIGDVITVTGASVSGYNAAQRVTQIIDEKTIVTNADFTAVSAGVVCTAQITIPDAEQPLYEFLTLSGSANASVEPDATYTNLDPLPNINIGVNRVLYAEFGTADTYKLVIRARIGVAMGD